MKLRTPIPTALGLLAAFAVAAAPARADAPDPDEVIAGIPERQKAMFQAEADRPLKRAAKRPPLGKGRGNFVRYYSYSIVEFAARCLYLGERLDEANAALAENAQHYLDNPKDINDRDSFHWHADIVMRLIEHYGTNGDKAAGRLTKETEDLLLKPIWIYAGRSSRQDAEFEQSKTWHLHGSENHHAMDFTTCWHFAKLARDRPEYRDQKYSDGGTAAEHYEAWSAYIVEYCRERARKGVCVEMMSDGYNTVRLKGFFNFHDFGPPDVSHAAGLFIDLYFAYWAQEQVGGHMGGGASRIKGDKAYSQIRHRANGALAWLFFGMGSRPGVGASHLNAALGSYRPPPVVVDIALDAEGRGIYEVRQRTQGLGKVLSGSKVKILRTDGGGIVRYTYCTPAYIMGTVMTEARPNDDWAPVSSESRWQGVAFADEHDSRIVPLVLPQNGKSAFNTHWSVQSKGSLITQKLKTHKGGGPMTVWLSPKGLGEPVREGDVVFVEGAAAHGGIEVPVYAAIRVPGSDFELKRHVSEKDKNTGSFRSVPAGWMVLPKDDFAPVIVEVAAPFEGGNFADFKEKVKATEPVIRKDVVTYKTIYGDLLTLDTGYKRNPTVNGKSVDYAPSKVLESPFLESVYDSGVVTIRKGSRGKTLDFNEPARP